MNRKERLRYMLISSLWFLWTPFVAIIIMGLVVGANNSNPVSYTMFLILSFLAFVSAMIYRYITIIKETKDEDR